MIVISVVGMASGIGVAALSRSLASKRLETSAWVLGSTLRQARSLALQQGIAHRVRVDIAENSYWVEVWKSGSEGEEEGYRPVGTELGRSHALPSDVHVDQMAPLAEPFRAGFDATGRGEAPVRIVLANRKGEGWTVAMGYINGRLFVLPGNVDPFDLAIRPELVLDGAVTDLPSALRTPEP